MYMKHDDVEDGFVDLINIITHHDNKLNQFADCLLENHTEEIHISLLALGQIARLRFGGNPMHM